MKPLASNARLLFLTVCMVLFWVARDAQAAERELHWDSLDVDARLAATGVLDVTERHAMVFTGDWNGGERVFNVRPRQKLEFISLERIEESTGRAEPLRQRTLLDASAYGANSGQTRSRRFAGVYNTETQRSQRRNEMRLCDLCVSVFQNIINCMQDQTNPEEPGRTAEQSGA